jgi:hypothetical protein
MSLPALTPLLPTLPAAAQPSDRQPPLPPVELPDETSSRDAVDDRGRATFTPRAGESAELSDWLRRGQSGASARLAGALTVRGTTQMSEASPEVNARRSRLVPSPAGINPRLLAMAMTQPIIESLLADWSEGRTVRLSVPASPARPELLAQALAQAITAPLSKAIIAVGMRQHRVSLAAPEAWRLEPGVGALDLLQIDHNELPRAPLPSNDSRPIQLSTTVTPDHTGALQVPRMGSPDNPHAKPHPGGLASQLNAVAGLENPEFQALPIQQSVQSSTPTQFAPGPNLTLSLTVLPLPVYLGEQMAAQAQQSRLAPPADPETEPRSRRQGRRKDDGEMSVSSVSRGGRMLRGQIDLGTRGLLNFEIRSLNGRFSVALGATADLGSSAEPGLPALEAALQGLPGFTELHWNG